MKLTGKIKASEIRGKILSDKYNSMIFSLGKNFEIYIVGGYIRDILLGKKDIDRDYVLKEDPDAFLEQLRKKTGGKVIYLGNKQLYRLMLKNGTVLDFTRLYKGKIEEDLSMRDFTVNAIAWSPERGLIDNYNGVGDLSARKIKMINRINIKRDPIRILRAYRLAGEMNFKIEDNTHKSLKQLYLSLKDVKTERITLEFFKILNINNPVNILNMMFKDRIVSAIIALNNKSLREKLKEINNIQIIFNEIPLRFKVKLDNIYSQNLTYRGLIRLEIILSGMPEHMLSLSSGIIKRITKVGEARKIIHKSKNENYDSRMFDALMIVRDAYLDLLLVENIMYKAEDAERFISIIKNGMIRPKEIIVQLNNNQNKKNIGMILKEIRRAEFLNRIKNKKSAKKYLEWIISNLT